MIADHTQWNPSDANYGQSAIKEIATHFSDSLDYNKFSLDMALMEWRRLMKLVATKFSHFKSKTALWQQVFKYHHEEFPHILLIIEIILVTAISSATVERGFSAVNRHLSNWRLSLTNDSLDDMLILRVNLAAMVGCDPFYEVKLIEKAVTLYAEAKRRRYTKKPQAQKRPAPTSVDALRLEHRPDTFLPTPASVLISGITNDLLRKESFVVDLSDDPDSDSDSVHGELRVLDSSDSESSDSDSELAVLDYDSDNVTVPFNEIDLQEVF